MLSKQQIVNDKRHINSNGNATIALSPMPTVVGQLVILLTDSLLPLFSRVDRHLFIVLETIVTPCVSVACW